MKKADCKEDIVKNFIDFVEQEAFFELIENQKREEISLDIRIAFIPYSDILKFRDVQMIREAEERMDKLMKAKRLNE